MAVMLVPAEVPDTCYLPEVAYWLAFSRVPEFHPEGLEADSRAGERIEAGVGPPEFHLFFSEREFSIAGVEFDYQRYFAVRERINSDSGKDFINIFKNNAGEVCPDGHPPERQSQEYLELMESLRQHIRREAEELDWAISMEGQLSGLVDVARTNAFQSVASGHLKAIGYVYEALPSEEEALKGNWVQIDPKMWTYRGFDWKKSTLTTPQATFHAVQVRTEDMLSIFPKPSCEAANHRASVYPGVVILEDGGARGGVGAMTARRPRGRPPKGDGAIRTAVQTTFEKRIMRGEVPTKLEALLQDVMTYVEETFRVKISRSTAQSYIASLRKMLLEDPAG